MSARPKIDMMEATRLTREGRLDEAMAVLRGALAGAPARGPSAARQGGRTPPDLDMTPPSAETGGSWTAAQFAAPPAGRRPNWPDALRGFLDRLGRRRSAPDLDAPDREAPAEPAAPAPAPRPRRARFDERSFANEAGRRAYKLYVPAGYSGEAVPLVVMLHGCTQSPDDFAAGTRMNDLAEEQVFLVAYPAQAPSANRSKCWNWFSAGDQQRDRGEPSLIAGITRQIMGEFAVEPERVYIAGLSAGGCAAAIMGTTYPDLYAAIGVHSGLACGAASDISSAFAAMRRGGSPGARRHGGPAVPTIVFHGDRDAIVNPANGDHVIAQSKAAAKLRTTVSRGEAPGGITYTRTVQTDDSGRPMLEHWTLHGAGHAWSGGSAAGSYTEPRGPDASREMLRFFREHPIAG